MDSTEENTDMVFLANLNPTGFNDFLLSSLIPGEVYCIMNDNVKGMHLGMNKIHDTSQLNL